MIVPALRTAAVMALGTPRWWALGLAGFLARGGIIVFALPVVVLPSVVGLATFIGPNSITAAGLAPRFVALLALVIAIAAMWVVTGTLVGCAVDAVLVPDVLGLTGSGMLDRPPGLGRLFAIRSICLVPFGASLAIAGVRLGQVGYQELILPSDSTTPLAGRVLLGAPDAVALLVTGWLACELVGAVAIRSAFIDGRTVAGALGAALGWIARQPIRAISLTLATVLGSVLVVGAALVVTSLLWGRLHDALLGPADPLAALLVIPFVALWAGALVLAGIVAAWRSTTWSLALVGDHRGGGPRPVASGTL